MRHDAIYMISHQYSYHPKPQFLLNIIGDELMNIILQ